MTTEAARQAAREFNDKLVAETGASLSPWILARVASAFDTFAAAQGAAAVAEAVAAGRIKAILYLREVHDNQVIADEIEQGKHEARP